jgi:hypothetical protein
MDILMGNGRSIQIKDFKGDYNLAPNLGKFEAGDDFLINGLLGECDPQDEWHSVDRIRFSLLQPLVLNLSLGSNTITEVVRLDSAGKASVVGSIEYGTELQLQLAPGCYGLSLFVEGGDIDYVITGHFL